MTMNTAAWSRIARRHPSAFLLAVQLLSLMVYTLFDGLPGGRLVFGAFGATALVLAVWVVNRSPAVNWVAWSLAIPALLCAVSAAVFRNQALLVTASLLEALLYFYAAGALILYMMNDNRVTADELFAAGATFTLLAWGFAYLFVVCQVWYPGSFSGAVEPERARTWLELLFLSFTNLAAVGLGDVLPLRSEARVLVMLEQFAGVGYVAVVVSRLIGLTILRQGRDS